MMWCAANEPMPSSLNLSNLNGPDPNDPTVARGKQFLDTLLARTRALDPSRLLTLVTVMGGPQSWMEGCDVICMNRYWGLIWLCGPGACFVNGVVVPVDGGFSAFGGV